MLKGVPPLASCKAVAAAEGRRESRMSTMMSRSNSRLGEERIPLSFKVVVEPELGTSRPAGTSGQDFKANRMVCPRLPFQHPAPCEARPQCVPLPWCLLYRAYCMLLHAPAAALAFARCLADSYAPTRRPPWTAAQPCALRAGARGLERPLGNLPRDCVVSRCRDTSSRASPKLPAC